MLFYLSQFSDCLGVLNVFRYQTFRMGCALTIAFFLTLWMGPYIIRWLKNKEGEGNCEADNFDDIMKEQPEGVSHCIDRQLSWKSQDHCCYARYQYKGVMYAKCVGLSEENYLDIVEYIRMKESGEEKLGSETIQLKIYDINCFSSYLKIFSASLLLALLF